MENWIKYSIILLMIYVGLFVADKILQKIQKRKKAVRECDRATSNADPCGDATCE